MMAGLLRRDLLRMLVLSSFDKVVLLTMDRVTALKANFMHTAQEEGELKL